MIVRTFKAADENLDDVTAFLEEELEKTDCDMKTSMMLAVCIEEIFVNVAHYAYPEGEGNVDIGIDTADNILTLRVTDSGIPFDPLAKEDPDITASAEERGIGGLGIFIVKKSMDDVTYIRNGKENILSFKKRIS